MPKYIQTSPEQTNRNFRSFREELIREDPQLQVMKRIRQLGLCITD